MNLILAGSAAEAVQFIMERGWSPTEAKYIAHRDSAFGYDRDTTTCYIIGTFHERTDAYQILDTCRNYQKVQV